MNFIRIVANTWLWLAEQYEYVSLDEWGLMPNYMPGIMDYAGSTSGRGASRSAPAVMRKLLGRIVGAFKTVSTKEINKVHIWYTRGPSACRGISRSLSVREISANIDYFK